MQTDQIAGAARAAVELIGGDVSFALSSPDPASPDAGVWTLEFADRMSGETLARLPVRIGDKPVELIWSMLDGLAEAIPVTSLMWGRPFPECDEHPHAALVRMSLTDAGEALAVALRCPKDDHLVRAITV